jgi:hypothetical protein
MILQTGWQVRRAICDWGKGALSLELSDVSNPLRQNKFGKTKMVDPLGQRGHSRISRAVRPPRRRAIRPARAGSSAMIAVRVSVVRRDHAEISSMVRWQPTQRRASGWMTQTLTQGLSISARCQMSSLGSGLVTRRSSSTRAGQAVLAGYSRRPRHRSPRRDVFVTYPPREVPFPPQQWRDVRPRR